MKKEELIYKLTVKYSSEYRTEKKVPQYLIEAQIRFLLDSRYCCLVDGNTFENSYGIDCAIPYICGGEFGWRLQSHDSIVSAVKVLYEEIYSPEAIRVEAIRGERSKKRPTRRVRQKNRILDMQRVKRGEIAHLPVRRWR